MKLQLLGIIVLVLQVEGKSQVNVCLKIDVIECKNREIIQINLPNCARFLDNQNEGKRCLKKQKIIEDAKKQCDGNDKCIFRVSNEHLQNCAKVFENKILTTFKCIDLSTSRNKKDSIPSFIDWFNPFDNNDQERKEQIRKPRESKDLKTKNNGNSTAKDSVNNKTEVVHDGNDGITKDTSFNKYVYTNSSSTRTQNITTRIIKTSFVRVRYTLTSSSETKIVTLYKNASIPVLMEKGKMQGNLSAICLNDNKTFVNGNFEWVEKPQCYITCKGGEGEWNCCESDEKFSTLCDKCLPSNQLTDSCVIKKLSDAEGTTESPTTSNSSITANRTNTSYYIPTTNFPAMTNEIEISKELQKLVDLNISISNEEAASESLNDIIKKAYQENVMLNTGKVNKVIENLLNNENKITNMNVTKNLVESFELLTASHKNNMTIQETSNILQQMDKLGSKIKLSRNKTSINFFKGRIAFGVHKNIKKDILFETKESNSKFSSILIPRGALSNVSDDKNIYFYNYLDSVLFKSSAKVSSNIMAGTVVDQKLQNLKDQVVINFAVNDDIEVSSNLTCVYWRPKIGNNTSGEWLTDGCYRVDFNNKNTVTCKCNHLTNFALISNFAVVLNPMQTFEESEELKMISFIGCFLSIIGLGLTLITFLCFKLLRKKIPSKILICLCISLLALLIVFVGGINQTENSATCHTVGVLLHYFTLTTFCWMTVEAINLYRTVVKVFSRGDDGTFFRWMFVTSWGLPAIIAGVSGFLDRKHFLKHDDDIHTKLCVVIGTPFYFAVLLPTCVLLLFNFVLFIPILRGIASGEKLLQDSIQDRQKMVAKRTKSSFAVLALLGLGWIFSILALGKLKVIFQWLFCIFTAFQGFCIFLLFVVFNPDAKKAWRQFFCSSSSPVTSGSYLDNMKIINEATTNESSIIIKSEHDDDLPPDENVELSSFAPN